MTASYGESGFNTKKPRKQGATGDVIVKANGARVEIHTDGSVDAYTEGRVQGYPAANDDSRPTPKADPQIGDVMPAGHKQAGWIYAGISKTTHEPFYVEPKDSGVFQWKEAVAFAANEGSRLPSKEKLDQLYDAKDKGALKGTFNVSGSDSAGWCWSSRDDDSYYGDAWAQRFSGGDQLFNY
jgi:hypothetical protein